MKELSIDIETFSNVDLKKCDGESYRHDGIPGIMLPEKTDFAMNVISVSADNSDVTGAFLGVLIKNEFITNLAYP